MLTSFKTLLLLISLVWYQTSICQETSNYEHKSVITFNGEPQLSIEEYFTLAQSYSEKYNYDSSLYYLSAAEMIALSLNDNRLLAEIKMKQGNAYSKKSLHAFSEKYYQEAIQIFEAQHDTNNLALANGKLGIAYKHSSKYSLAFEAQNKALTYYVHLGDSLGIANTKINVGNIFKNIGNLERAKTTYKEALEIFVRYDIKKSIGNCFNNIGNVFKNQLKYDSALFYMHQTLKIRNETDDQRGKSFAYHNLANLHLKLNQIDSALFYIDESYRIKLKTGDIIGQAEALEVYGEIFMAQESWDKSIRHLETALLLSKNYNDWILRRDLLKNLAICHNKVGNYNKSSDYFMLYLENEETLQELNSREQLEEELLKYELLSDSIRVQQLILEKDLEDAKNENARLANKVLKKNLYLLGVGILLLLLVFVPMLIRYRNKLIATKESHRYLQKSSVPKEEKEILLKEVHHRVKNNFQIINSLIRIQSEFMTKDNYKMKLKDIETRIRSMALIHEKLYKSDKISKLNIKDYLTELTGNIIDSYETSTKINFSLNVDEVEYGIDTLIPLGLILNEAISNSIKHAFKGQSEGSILIDLHDVNGSTELLIKDNGKGSNLSIEELKTESLGLELILDLTEQLDGQLKLDTTNGFAYSFIFPRLK